MEHYDGPAFYRKFPVEPTPEQMADTTDDRSQRLVRLRKERNERLRLREQREQRRADAAQSAAQEVLKQTHRQKSQSKHTPKASTPEAAAAAESANYRPFSVTPVPKQRVRVWQPSLLRRKYQRLVANFHKKSPASFFLLGTAADEAALREAEKAQTPVAPTVVFTPKQTITPVEQPTVVFQPQATTHDKSDEVAASTTTSSEAGQVVPTAEQQHELTEPAQKASATVETVTSTVDTSSEATVPVPTAPTEVFYPESQSQSASEAYLPVDNQPAAATMADEQSVQESVTDTSMSKNKTAKGTTTHLSSAASSAVAATSTASSVTPSITTDSAEATSGVAESAAQPAEVTALLQRAEMPDSSVAATGLSKASQASSTASAADESVTTAATTSAAPRSVAPKSQAKPSRGLGHSLGDIMQEEGNDQRNLALFDRPTDPQPAATTPERGYHFPNLNLLPKPVVPDEAALDEWIEHQAEVLDATLSAFHVDAHVTDWTVGPTVTQFQISLALGVKVNKITNLNDDLKLALAAKDIRIEAPIPGKTTVGIEIPNLKSRPVMLSEILNSAAFKNSESPLTVALGVDLFGKPQVTDLRKMPHGLIAGATGSGKSVFINSLLLSILYKATPQQVKLLLIDPKAVEMAPYDALPHLLSPVISDPKAAAAALKWVVTEMDERYEKLAAAGVRNIEQFNDRADANDEPSLKMPYIVIIIDELADLMMMAASEVQDYIVRITQKARAAGIHLLVATQRPSVDIVTGTIKNNIPTRIAFMVSSQIDSRTILDTAGAENLLGRGDMLYLGNGASQPMRLQGAFVESEVDGVTDFVRTQGQPHYAFSPKGLLQRETAEENQDELLPKVLEYIAQEKTVSTSKLQRVFSIGYNRAANLIDDLEQHHYVSPQHGSKPREVYLTPDDLGKDLPEPHDQSAPFSS